MTDRDTAAALAKALPAGNVKAYDDFGVPFSHGMLANIQAERLSEAGWVLVRPDDEATVERVRAKISDAYYDARNSGQTMTIAAENAARAALAALAARPGTAEEATDV